jgi:hypothetical protein
MAITREQLNQQIKECHKDGTFGHGNREQGFCHVPGMQYCEGDTYLMPYRCPRLMKKFVVRVEPVKSIDIEVDASDEDEAYKEALQKWSDIEPEMAIIKQE